MSNCFEQAETLCSGTNRIAGLLLGEAVAGLQHPAVRRDEGVHECRKQIKMLRALLRLVCPGMRKRAFQSWNSALRDTARLLSGIRDEAALDECVQVLLDRYAAAGNEITALTALQTTLAHARKNRDRSGATQTGGGEGSADALKVLLDLLDTLKAPLLKNVGDGGVVLEKGLHQSYQAGRRAWKAMEAGGDIEAVHEWRKRAKDLRYQITFLEAVWPKQCAAWEGELHQLTDALGFMHDLWLLEQTLSGPAGAELAEAVRTRAGAVMHRAAAQARTSALWSGRRLYHETPRCFAKGWAGWWKLWCEESTAAVGAPAGDALNE